MIRLALKETRKHCTALNPTIRHFTTRAAISESKMKLSSYRYFLPMPTRWNDNDSYGHVNNSVYFFYSDTVINNYFIWHCGLGNEHLEGKGSRLMKYTQFDFRSTIKYPQVLLCGLAVTKIGNSSVQTCCGILVPKIDYFTIPLNQKNDPLMKLGIGSQGILLKPDNSAEKLQEISNYYEEEPCAVAKAVHVFVDANRKPVKKLSQVVKEGCEKIYAFSSAM